jgi:Leucine-rich repeat (LRR) protein
MLPHLMLLMATLTNPAEWIADEGGSFTRDRSGEIVAVDFTGAWVTDADLRRLEGLHYLRTLNLTRTKITDVGMEHLAKLTGVTDLNLCFAEYLTEDGIAHLKGWTALERLNLRGTKVTSKVFPTLGRLTSLRSLDLANTQIDDDGFEELAALPKLEELAIGGNRLTGACLSLLRPIQSLRRLDVGGMQRVDSGLWGLALTGYNLARLASLTQLESLTLAGANLSDRGIDRPGQAEAIRTELRDLAALAQLVNLQVLDLSGTPVSADALAALRQLPRLRELRLGVTPKIDDSAVGNLLALRQVKSLYVAGSGITAAGLARLRAEGHFDRLDTGESR